MNFSPETIKSYWTDLKYIGVMDMRNCCSGNSCMNQTVPFLYCRQVESVGWKASEGPGLSLLNCPASSFQPPSLFSVLLYPLSPYHLSWCFSVPSVISPGAGITEADDRQVTTVFTVQPSFHHRHLTNRVSWSVTIVGERAVTPPLVARRRW